MLGRLSAELLAFAHRSTNAGKEITALITKLPVNLGHHYALTVLVWRKCCSHCVLLSKPQARQVRLWGLRSRPLLRFANIAHKLIRALQCFCDARRKSNFRGMFGVTVGAVPALIQPASTHNRRTTLPLRFGRGHVTSTVPAPRQLGRVGRERSRCSRCRSCRPIVRL